MGWQHQQPPRSAESGDGEAAAVVEAETKLRGLKSVSGSYASEYRCSAGRPIRERDLALARRGGHRQRALEEGRRQGTP